jgi:hypothetical protein
VTLSVVVLMAGSALVLFAWRGARAALARIDDTDAPAAPVSGRPASANTRGARIVGTAAALE